MTEYRTDFERGEIIPSLDINDNFMPVENFKEPFVTDENNDIMPPILIDVEDNEFELDANGDIMPKI